MVADDVDATTVVALEMYEGFKHFHALRRYLEVVGHAPEITDELSRVGRSGVPTYVIISGSGQTTTHVLPELLTRGVVLDAIRQAGTNAQSQTAAPISTEKTGG